MTRLGDALLAETGALRINYAMFGNQEPALHAHVVPRYRNEVPGFATAHPWAYEWAAAPLWRDADLEALRARLRTRLRTGPLDQA
jgi:diadenosine tetraphosphate (Ap4A) HIT family hydrolase